MHKTAAERVSSGETFSTASLDAADAVGRWYVDVAQELVTSDAMVAFLFGFTPEQAKGGMTFQAFNSGVHPCDRAYAMAGIDQCIRNGGWFITEHRVSSVDGQTRKILARGRFDRNADGTVTSGSGIVVDITHRQEGDDPFDVPGMSKEATSLEQATDLILASHAVLRDAGEPGALVMVEALLMLLGRRLAQSQTGDYLKLLH